MSELLTTAEKLATLRSCAAFREVPLQDLHGVSERVELERYEAGEAVFRKGDAPRAIYVVSAGRVAIEQRREPPLRIAELGRGEIFGEMAVLAGGAHRRAAIAVTGLTVLAIDVEAFRRLASRHPEVLAGVGRVLGERLNHADRWLERRAREAT